ncbi:hypothetical protein COY23_03555 [bacterium (Candidatus Torokbacteria) CG_4_10_14_0_2_um_filter_35_8]|nr:MAG: hypothetical protein COY23_03555 [bacterium (Candidatus Torokbacteria) CG_4_10_14_0_2_um_filter_35_8]
MDNETQNQPQQPEQPQEQPQQAAPAQPQQQGDEKDIAENKLWAVLGYLGILCLIPLLAKKDSPFAQFHAKQGLVYMIAGLILGFVSWIPILGWIVGAIGGLVMFVLWIMAIIKVLSGQYWEMPIIGQFAKKINI